VIIRPMHPSDFDFAESCTAAEGWASETRLEFEGFLAHDPGGCFVAETQGRQIGICIATPYGESGFIGELIIIPDMRGLGTGRRLLEHAIEYLRSRGARNISLDGDPPAVPLYERVGFRKVCRSLRFIGNVQGRSHPHVRAMREIDLEAVSAMDRQAFGADRRFFLERSLSLYPELGKVIECDGQLTGFIMGRRGNNVVSAGPWIVQPGLERPGDLLEGLATQLGDAKLRVGLLETNSEAAATLRRLGLTEHPDPPWRMVLGPLGHLGLSNQAYAIGSAAKG
jgi:ribosomal protein S18 acetylase RimI-like enzyme